jgi:hypothetical protein
MRFLPAPVRFHMMSDKRLHVMGDGSQAVREHLCHSASQESAGVTYARLSPSASGARSAACAAVRWTRRAASRVGAEASEGRNASSVEPTQHRVALLGRLPARRTPVARRTIYLAAAREEVLARAYAQGSLYLPAKTSKYCRALSGITLVRRFVKLKPNAAAFSVSSTYRGPSTRSRPVSTM